MQVRRANFTPILMLAVIVLSCGVPAPAQQKKKQDGKARQERTEQAGGVWKRVNDLLGRKGKQESPGVWKYDLTRDDLHLKINGDDIKPEMALDGWVTFQQTARTSRMMGELVLTPDEINPVIDKLQEGGVQEMALHNHLTGESPSVMYLHIRAEGDPVIVAQALRSALSQTKTPLQEKQGEEKLEGIDAAQIKNIIGGEQESEDGVLSLEIKRRDTITEGKLPIPPAMEVSSEAKFQPTSNGHAILYGEIVLVASEVNPVLRVLRKNNISVMALHNHMLTEQPRVFFIHCMAKGDALTLARAIRAALDQTNSEKPGK